MTRAATPADVLSGAARWCVVDGNALALLASSLRTPNNELALFGALPDGCIDAVVTDSPYSSGGFTRADRTRRTDTKYTKSETQGRHADFTGDSRSQRAFIMWSSLWMEEARRACTADGRLVTFTDWRQIGCTIDAVECGGWIFRGVVPWNKGNGGGRPVPGGFRSQCEYIVWGSTGPLPKAEPGVGVLDGFYTVPVDPNDKHHQTGKPTLLMRELVQIAPKGGVILDPFAGSGTTGVAALLEGRRVILCERVAEHVEKARTRCEEVTQALATPVRAGRPGSGPLFGEAG